MVLISSSDVQRIIVRWFEDSFAAELAEHPVDVKTRVIITDAGNGYGSIDAHVAHALLTGDATTDAKLYKPGFYDCEDFAFAARVTIAFKILGARAPTSLGVPPAFGILMSQHHALNIGIGDDSRPYLLDVVTGKVHRGASLANALDDVAPQGWLDSFRRIFHVVI
jgi:hypothetical protein